MNGDAGGTEIAGGGHLVDAGDLDFDKIWVANILSAIDEISNAKVKVLMYLIRVRDPHTQMIVQTVKEIAAGSKTSPDTMKRTLRSLIRHDILRRQHPRFGVLILNANAVSRGTSAKRRGMLIRFEQIPLPFAQTIDHSSVA